MLFTKRINLYHIILHSEDLKPASVFFSFVCVFLHFLTNFSNVQPAENRYDLIHRISSLDKIVQLADSVQA